MIKEMDPDSPDSYLTRRALLKMAAGAPLVLTFAMLASPLTRLFRPSMRPGEFFQPAEFPQLSYGDGLTLSDFARDGDYKLLDLECSAPVFGAEKTQKRIMPAVVVRLSQHNVVAFSRICPRKGCLLQYKTEFCCGCANSKKASCGCAAHKNMPVLVCVNDERIYNLSDGGHDLYGQYCRPVRQFVVRQIGEQILIERPDFNWIA